MGTPAHVWHINTRYQTSDQQPHYSPLKLDPAASGYLQSLSRGPQTGGLGHVRVAHRKLTLRSALRALGVLYKKIRHTTSPFPPLLMPKECDLQSVRT
jgi:hypothetical protein